jgi:quercetin dioxygenase-like cupin family protein
MNDSISTLTNTFVSDPASPRGIWFLGSLVRMPLRSEQTAGRLAVLEHRGERGYSAPMHRHRRDDETFVVLEGSIHLVSDGKAYRASAGSTVFLARGTLHGFVVDDGPAHFLTIHTPGGFDSFTLDAGHEVVLDPFAQPQPPVGVVVPSSEELTLIAARYGIEIVGPPPALPEHA